MHPNFAFTLLITLALLLTVHAQTQFKIVAVVDAIQTGLLDSLDVAFRQLSPTTLAGGTATLTTFRTHDNDSFGALDTVCGELSKSGTISAILDFSSRHVSAAMRSLSQSMGIAHISGVHPAYESSNQYSVSINIRPPSSQMLHIIRSIVTQENVTRTAIIFDETFDLTDKPRHLLRNIPVQHMYQIMATRNGAITAQLQMLKDTDIYHIFLAATAQHVANYLSQANKMDMFLQKYTWYIITKDGHVGCPGCLESSSFVTLTGQTGGAQSESTYISYMSSQTGEEFTSHDIDMGAAYVYDVIAMMGTALGQLNGGGRWTDFSFPECLALTDTNADAKAQAEDLVTTMANSNYMGVFGAYDWTGHIAEQPLTLDVKRDHYMDGSVSSTSQLGTWSVSGGLTGVIQDASIQTVYRVITMHDPPFTFKSLELPARVPTLENGGVLPGEPHRFYRDEETGYYYYGYCVDLMLKIQSQMVLNGKSFAFMIVEPPDGVYGSLQQDGSWTGMVNELLEDRADIIAAPFSIMAERENVVDFTVPYYDLVGITILAKKPEITYAVFKFMEVMEPSVWSSFLTVFLLVSCLIALFDRCSPYSYQNNKHDWPIEEGNPKVFTLKESLWFTMTSVTPQGGGELPVPTSARLVAGGWWIFGFLLINTYIANLAAFLTVSRLESSIGSLNDLTIQSKIEYAPSKSTATEIYFRRMKDIENKFYDIWKTMSLYEPLTDIDRAKLSVWDYPLSTKYTNIWATMQDNGFPGSTQEAIERVKASDPDNDVVEFVYIADSSKNKYATSIDCGLQEVGDEFSRKPYALAVQEGSPLKHELSKVILELLNQRYLEGIKSYWWDFDKVSCPIAADESAGISIQDIGGVFLVIFLGIGLGLIALLFEYYWYRWSGFAVLEKTTEIKGVDGEYEDSEDSGDENFRTDYGNFKTNDTI